MNWESDFDSSPRASERARSSYTLACVHSFVHSFRRRREKCAASFSPYFMTQKIEPKDEKKLSVRLVVVVQVLLLLFVSGADNGVKLFWCGRTPNYRLEWRDWSEQRNNASSVRRYSAQLNSKKARRQALKIGPPQSNGVKWD